MTEAEILAQDVAALAFCWRLERRDGVTIGLTSHDRDLTIDGLVYRAAPGIAPSAIRRGIGLEPESLDVQGALSAAAISAEDLAAGRWDGASVALYLTDWAEAGLWMELARGTLGGVERRGDAFTAELRGAAAALERAVAPETSPDCRAALGDRACRVDLNKHRRVVAVAAAEGETVTVEAVLGTGLYGFGGARWLTGRNAGIAQAVVASDAGSVTLADPPPLPVMAGDRLLLTEGCDKRMESCAGRFGNAVNFRGEPYLPGNDLLTRYPGAQ